VRNISEEKYRDLVKHKNQEKRFREAMSTLLETGYITIKGAKPEIIPNSKPLVHISAEYLTSN
jgi:hypothetical protein